MPGLRYPERVRERAKSLWENGFSISAIARQLQTEFGDFAPARNTVGLWAKEWGNGEVAA